MNETYVTFCGNVVADPTTRSTKTGKPFASFRIGSTSRRWDAATSGFVDGPTNWVNVVGFNALGANIMASLKKGDPVVVHGRLRVNQYVASDGRNMTSVEVDAQGVGHDLVRGQTVFSRVARAQYDVGDRMADPAVQEAFAIIGDDEREPGDFRDLESEPDGLAGLDTGPLVPSFGPTPSDDGRGGRGRGGAGGLREEDADTDEYVVVGQ